MTRQSMLLVALGAALAIALFWLLAYQPGAEDLAQVRDEITATEALQDQARQRILELQAVRDQATELRAQLAAAESIIPRETALPELLDALADAADDAGVVLVSVAPGRPLAMGEADGAAAAAGADGDDAAVPVDLSRMSVSVQVDGSYEDIVEFLRLVEDPESTPRGILWRSISLAEGGEGHPELAASLSGDMFALVPPGGTEPIEPDVAPTDQPTPDISASPSPNPEGGDA